MTQSSKALFGKMRSIFTGLGLFVSILMPVAAHAQSATTVTASSSAGKVGKDSMFQVTVHVNAGQPVTLAQALVKYDPSKLELVEDPDYADSPFNQESPDNVRGNDYYQLSRFKMGGPYPTGTFKLAEFTFKALGDSGSTVIEIDPAGTAVFAETPAGENVLSTTSGVRVDLVAYTETPYPGTQLIVAKEGSSAELRSTPAATDGNNGYPTDEEAPTKEEVAALADTTAERTGAASSGSELTDESKSKAWFKDPKVLISAGSLLALLIVTALFLARRNKKPASAATAQSASPEGPVAGDQPTVFKPEDKDQ